MINFKVGKEIVSLLKADFNFNRLIGNKVYPVIADAKATFPFVVYRRSGYRPAENKDYLGEIVSVEFAVASVTYEEGLTIANALCDALIGKETDIIQEVRVTQLSEDFIEDTFVERVFLDVELK